MKQNYTPEEVFWIFKEEHRLCSPLDFMADPGFDLKFTSKIWEWRDCRDLLEWEELSDFLNQEFRINLPRSEWEKVFEPEDKRTIGDVGVLISNHATKANTEPIKLLGGECLSASLFLTLKKNLKGKGVDVSNLKPSSKIAPYLEEYFSPMIEEIVLSGVKVFDTLEYKIVRREKIVSTLWDRLFHKFQIKGEFVTGDVVAFRDLINKIINSTEYKNV